MWKMSPREEKLSKKEAAKKQAQINREIKKKKELDNFSKRCEIEAKNFSNKELFEETFGAVPSDEQGTEYDEIQFAIYHKELESRLKGVGWLPQ